jgi:hypothetical protein
MIFMVITPGTFDCLIQVMVSFEFNTRSFLLICWLSNVCFDLASRMCQFGELGAGFSFPSFVVLVQSRSYTF